MKTLDEFVKLFAEQFDATDASEMTPSTSFHELEEYSSLIALSIIAMVDEEFGIILNGNDIRTSVTIEDLYDTVEAKQA